MTLSEINALEEKHLNNSMRAAQDVELGTRLKTLQTQDAYTYSGIRTEPTVADNGNGSITIGNAVCSLYPDSSGSGTLEIINVSGSTFTL
jgi:hypothetical protein